MAVMAVLDPAICEKLGASIGNNGSAPTQLTTRTGDAREDFSVHAQEAEERDALSG